MEQPCRQRSSVAPMLRLIGVVVLAGVLIAGCTAIRLGYDHADSLIVSWLDRYLDLTAEQEDLVRSHVRDMLAWHRHTQLPDYVKLIDGAREKIGAHITGADVLAFNDAVNRRLLRIGERAAPDIAQLALTLTPAQIDRLERKMGEDTARIKREFAANTERSNTRRMRRFIEHAEGWFGDFREDQLVMVRAAYHARPAAGGWFLEDRSRRQADLVSLLRRVQSEHPDAATVTAWVHSYFAQLAQPIDTEERAQARKQLRHDNAELIANLVNSADAGQRASITKRLAGYAEDFTKLANEHRPG